MLTTTTAGGGGLTMLHLVSLEYRLASAIAECDAAAEAARTEPVADPEVAGLIALAGGTLGAAWGVLADRIERAQADAAAGGGGACGYVRASARGRHDTLAAQAREVEAFTGAPAGRVERPKAGGATP